MPTSTLLVIDDEANIVFSIQECLATEKRRIISAANGREGLELVRTSQPDVVLLDVRLPDMTGLEVFDQIRAIDSRVPVVMITAYARTETAIEAMSRGAFEYLLKPVDFRRLKEVVEKAIEISRLSRVPAVLEDDPAPDDADQIVGHSPAMQEVYKSIGRIAPQDATVLILGESGTGKELAARAIYHYSRRRDKTFLAINCAALPETLLESELFGHERGAFTGADQRRIGKFEQVNGGTIFLDEIGDMSPATQAKALRLLQEQRFERVGGNTTVQTNVRVIAATNQNLAQAVGEGRFRQDLFYRLNGFTIQLPPLRERKEDLPILAEHFVKRFNRELGKNVSTITPSARQMLIDHDWPGNVREMQSAIKFAMVQATSDVITPDCLPETCLGRGAKSFGFVEAELADELHVARLVRELLQDGRNDIYRRVASAMDQVVLREVLSAVGGNQAQAAERLGISRMTLRSKMRALGMLESREAE